MWRIGLAPNNNDSKWQVGFNSAFKGLSIATKLQPTVSACNYAPNSNLRRPWGPLSFPPLFKKKEQYAIKGPILHLQKL
jgi:hypothetical protein